MHKTLLLLLLIMVVSGCHSDGGEIEPIGDSPYFPSTTNSVWETTSISSLGWNPSALQPLKDFLAQKNSKAFMILVDGRIVVEVYFNGHTASSSWEWNSAGKTLVSATVGIAQQEGLLDIHSKASTYLAAGWTNMPLLKENLITVRHLLSMSTGIDESKQLVVKSNLTYVADAGTRWAYGNVFQKLFDVVAQASNSGFETYFEQRLKNKIGMDGHWEFGPIFTIYHSTARSMARFGLLALNKGKWIDEPVINELYFSDAVSPSQNINPSYGYLWWLNGKSSFMIPGEQTIFTGALVPNAPLDMVAAMGANDQRIYVIPSKKMVVVRMGEASDPSNPNFAVSGFDSELWAKINALMD